MKRSLTILCILFALLFSGSLHCFAQQPELVTNATVIQLQKIGLGKDVIKAKIEHSTCSFDLSTDALITLKKAGVADEVITAMMTKGTPTAAPSGIEALSSGIYYANSDTKGYEEIEPSVVTNAKSGGFGEAMKRSVSGLFNAKSRATLSGAQAVLKVHGGTPTFLFVFDAATHRGLGDKGLYNTGAQSPNEFFLVILKVVKNTREVVTGKESSVSASIGIDDKLKIPFTSKKLQPGIYEVSVPQGLLSGEYCFMASASSIGQGMNSKVYDFSVR